MHRYHGAFAPHARLRTRIAARAGQPIVLPHELARGADLAAVIGVGLGRSPQSLQPLPEPTPPPRASPWARLIARLYEVEPLRCRHCGATMRLVAFIVEPAAIMRLLEHLGEPTRAPRAAPIRDPRWIASPRQRGRACIPAQTPAPETSFDAMPDYEHQRQDIAW